MPIESSISVPNSGTAAVDVVQVSPTGYYRQVMTIGDSSNAVQMVSVDTSGSLYTRITSVFESVDSLNSTTTPLGANASFTGPWVNCLGFNIVNVLINADQPSASGGVAIQFSTDGVNLDHQHVASFAGGGATGDARQAHIHAQYYRIFYTNGIAAQSYFRLQSILKPIGAQGSVIETDLLPTTDDDALLVKGTLIGRTSTTTGTYSEVLVDGTGGLKTSINGNIVTGSGEVLVTSTSDDVVNYSRDDDGNLLVNPNVPGADIATGDKQSQIIQLLTTLLNSGAIKLTDSVGNLASIMAPFGGLNVSMIPTTVFIDTFDGIILDSTKWKSPIAAGTGSVSYSQGTLTLNSGTTASGYSSLTSLFQFGNTNPGWLEHEFTAQLEYPITTGAYRFWGVGVVNTPFSNQNVCSDGLGWEIGTNGHLCAVTYQGGTGRILISDLNLAGKQPQDGSMHRYIIFYRGDRVYWAIDNESNIIASMLTGVNGPNINQLPLCIVNLNVSNGSNLQINFGGIFIGDTVRGNIKISDGQSPQNFATIKPANTYPVNTDTSLSVAISPQAVTWSNQSQETNGQLQKIADTLEAVLVELKVLSITVANLGQPNAEDPDRLRSDFNFSVY